MFSERKLENVYGCQGRTLKPTSLDEIVNHAYFSSLLNSFIEENGTFFLKQITTFLFKYFSLPFKDTKLHNDSSDLSNYLECIELDYDQDTRCRACYEKYFKSLYVASDRGNGSYSVLRPNVCLYLISTLNKLQNGSTNNTHYAEVVSFQRDAKCQSFPIQLDFLYIIKLNSNSIQSGCSKLCMKTTINAGFVNHPLNFNLTHISPSKFTGKCLACLEDNTQCSNHLINTFYSILKQSEKNHFKVVSAAILNITSSDTDRISDPTCVGIALEICFERLIFVVVILNTNKMALQLVPDLDKYHENVLWSKNTSTQYRLQACFEEHGLFAPLQKFTFRHSFHISFWTGNEDTAIDHDRRPTDITNPTQGLYNIKYLLLVYTLHTATTAFFIFTTFSLLI